MELETYDVRQNKKSKAFQFTSIGKKGNIQKLVLYQQTGFENLYNLAFGDYNTVTKELDDLVVTDNGDGDKVLATVVSTIHKFFSQNPKAIVYLTGSTPSRTRLYRIAITKYLPVFEENYEILGELETDWERFKINCEYQGFFIKLKSNGSKS
jgi:hypothetical protein